MAKKSMVERERKREKLVAKYSNKRADLNKQFLQAGTMEEKWDLHRQLEKLPRNSAQIRLRKRCWRTGRPRGVFNDFGLCRHMIREMSHNGLLPGMRKASW
jgi:small subunit ribosomal protein S14